MRFLLIKVLLVTIIYSFTIQISVQPALASCVPPLSLTEYKGQADIVVLGRVEGLTQDYVDVTVLRYFKGHGGPSKIKVTGKESPNAITSVDFNLEEDKKYLLFLKTSSSGILKTNACVGNKEITGELTEEELAVLGQGFSPSGNNQDLSYTPTPEPTNILPSKNILFLVLIAIFGLGGIFYLLNRKR